VLTGPNFRRLALGEHWDGYLHNRLTWRFPTAQMAEEVRAEVEAEHGPGTVRIVHVPLSTRERRRTSTRCMACGAPVPPPPVNARGDYAGPPLCGKPACAAWYEADRADAARSVLD
jgi:hypothetical protein